MLDAHSGMRFPQLIDAGFKDCSKLPAEKERPQVPHPGHGNADVLATTDTMTQSEGTKKTGAPARDRGSGLRQ